MGTPIEGTKGLPAHPATGANVDGKMSLELDDLRDNIRKGPGIKWNNGRPIDLSKSELAAVTSRISTRYYYFNTRHNGVQLIDRTTDGKNAQHYVYLYTDHGFGSYQIIGRLTYGQNNALISFLRKEIDNDRTAEGISEGTYQLRDFYERPGGGGLSHHNGESYDGNEQTDIGSRGEREKGGRWTGRTDTGRHDGGSNGDVSGKASRELEDSQKGAGGNQSGYIQARSADLEAAGPLM